MAGGREVCTDFQERRDRNASYKWMLKIYRLKTDVHETFISYSALAAKIYLVPEIFHYVTFVHFVN